MSARKSRKPAAKQSPVMATLNFIKTLAIALAMALLVKYSVIEAYNVPTGSMEDTILVGDFLLANKFIYGVRIPFVNTTFPGLRDPKPGDVVVFKFPLDSTTNYVKRCVAVGGQTVEVKNKILFIDGERFMKLPNLKHTRPNILPRGTGRNQRDNFGPYLVPEKHYFMMGDNRDDSYDSRFWGPVPNRFIMGKALVIHWSWGEPNDKEYPKLDWTDISTWVPTFWYNFLHFHERVRWERLGSAVS